MRTKHLTTDYSQPGDHRYALRRGLGFWELTFEGQRAVFKHDQGALYVACLLLDPPPEPIHAVALALKARKINGQSPEKAELIQERNLGLDDAEAVRNLRRKQRALEGVLDDELAIEPVKVEARREREEILEFLRKNSLRTRDNAGRCVRAVAVAIKRFQARLAKAVDAEGRPHRVLQGFARHLREHLLIPSGRGGGHGGARASWSGAGCFTYEPPTGVVWSAECGTSNTQHRTSNIQRRAKGACVSSDKVCGPIEGEVTNWIASGVCNPAGVAGHARRFKNTHR